MSLSPVHALLNRIVELGSAGHVIIDDIFDKLPVHEQAALAYDWEGFWARPAQLAPRTDWRSWGWLGGRGLGKTRAVSEHINLEVQAGRAMSIGLAAQDESNCIDLQVLGPSGLVATAPPWFKPEWHASSLQLVWPNGARAYVRTPEVPGKIRGFDYHLSWICEIQSWPAASLEEAYSNFVIATRVGYARMVWDATPKKNHPLLKELLKASARDPASHVVVRGSTRDNAVNLGTGYLKALLEKYDGTTKGREEIDGEMIEESERALVKLEMIKAHRRIAPAAFVRRVISIDPAVTTRAGNDRTGIIDDALGADGQVYVMGDYSGRHAPSVWSTIVLERYVLGHCDCVVVETNKGGDLVTQNLRAGAEARNLTVVVLGKEERARHVPGIVYVREVHARGEKSDRAQPLQTAYERGRVSHVIGVDLSELEEILTTWEPTPGQRSPDALDAHVHGVVELLGLLSRQVDHRLGFQGLGVMNEAIGRAPSPAASSVDIAALLRGNGGGGRI